MKENFVFNKIICGLLLVALGITSISCQDNYKLLDPDTDNATGVLDGLWVEQVKSGTLIIPHLDIKGNNVVLCKSNPANCDYSNRVDGRLKYDADTREGLIYFSDGTNMKFLCDEQDILCSIDTIPYYKINNTLDALQEMKINPNLPVLKDFIGPSKDLGIDLSSKTLLGDENLYLGSAWYVDFLKWAGESIAKGALSWGAGKSMQLIFDCFYTDPTSQKLESILSQIGEINSKLNQIEELIKMENYEKYINQRTNDYCNPLTNYSKRYADAMLAVDENDSTAIANIVNHWHDDLPVISGSLGGPMEAASNYMDFLMTTRVDQTNIYAIYDLYTFNCVPWAHMGYDFRQSLRASDLALITNNVNMAILYAKVHNWDKDPLYRNYVTDLNKKVQEFITFCEAVPVDVTDNLVCQIKGAHFVMENDFIIRDYNLREGGMTWYWPGCQFIHGDNQTSDLIIYGGMDMSIEQFRQKQITPEELAAISKYYDPSLTWHEIFRSIGLPSTENFLLLNGGTSADYDDHIYYHSAELNLSEKWREPNYDYYLRANTHWSFSFKYWFDGWDLPDWAVWGKHYATNVLYRY
ncbi:MAG: hypothetical protein HUJ90_07630 [Bacteroidales bacterium]|nr:hypothetical protein [Bacteroidales bacterium]